MSKPTSCLITFGFNQYDDGVTCFARYIDELYINLNYYKRMSHFYLDCNLFLFAVMRRYDIPAVWQEVKGSDVPDKFNISDQIQDSLASSRAPKNPFD